MSVQHTPGPWVVVEDIGGGKLTNATISAPAGAVAEVRGAVRIYGEVHPENYANAHLLAAAPELLAALKDMFALLDEGALVRNITDDSKPGFAMRTLPLIQRLQRAQAAIAKATTP